MKTNVYIHIGLHKTGTTSIQATLSNNRKTLLAHGINYLPLGENHSVALYPLFAAEPHRYRPNRAAGIDTEQKAAKKNAVTLASLQRELDANTSGSVVISGEDLSMLPAEGLKRLKETLAPYAAQFRIIVYIRDPVATVTSIFQQRLRRGQTYQQISRRPPRPGYQRIAASIDVFGREAVDVRLFDSAQFVSGDLIADFLSAIGADLAVAATLDPLRANVGLSHEAAELLHEINRRHPPQGRLSPPRDQLLARLAEIPGQPYRVPRQAMTAAQPGIEEDLRWLRGLLGDDVFPVHASGENQVYWQKQTVAAVALMLHDLGGNGSAKRWWNGRVVPFVTRIMRR